MLQTFHALNRSLVILPPVARCVVTALSLIPMFQLLFFLVGMAYSTQQAAVVIKAFQPLSQTNLPLLAQWGTAGQGFAFASMGVLALNVVMGLIAPVVWFLLWKKPTSTVVA